MAAQLPAPPPPPGGAAGAVGAEPPTAPLTAGSCAATDAGPAALCSGVVLAASVTAYCSAPPFINCTNWLWKAAAWADSA
ncbi:hypothetical protein B0172_04083 [Mycobacterium avium subsp. paratuberculosis]|nr:hypothetical protein B0172_04083 [Mycobacterium avium subsp. paratuberculosis]